VHAVDTGNMFCGKSSSNLWQNVENFLKKIWKYGEKVVDRREGL
jgi:hypothetical protein